MIDFERARLKMVESQLRTEDVTDYDVLAAMGTVARERFVRERHRPLAYIDEDLVLTEPGATVPRYLMRPAGFAKLIQLVEIAGPDKVLDVGCGGGYSAAVLTRLARTVVALESDARLAAAARQALDDAGVANATVVAGPLAEGWSREAPYDAIVLEGSVERVPEALFGQLAEGGRLVAIVGYGRSALATVYTKMDREIGSRPAFSAAATPLPGFEKPRTFVF
jgi:protein-L-isoaspartate(D-aspartate) O-methyltransferase